MLLFTAQLPLKAKFFSPPTRSIRHIIARAGELAGIPFQVHPHQLRHACGYYLAASGHDTRAIQDYLGHKNIHHMRSGIL